MDVKPTEYPYYLDIQTERQKALSYISSMDVKLKEYPNRRTERFSLHTTNGRYTVWISKQNDRKRCLYRGWTFNKKNIQTEEQKDFPCISRMGVILSGYPNRMTKNLCLTYRGWMLN